MENKKIFLLIKSILFTTLIVIILIGCEPISVSVNSKGEIAFTRSEGVFYLDYKSNKLILVDWNYGQPMVPAIIRWAPRDFMLAVTIKPNKDSQQTKLYTIDKGGSKKMIYEADKIITQVEWAPDGNYISIAQAGSDSNMNVADLVLINLKDGSSKIIAQNTGDVHNWLDKNSLVFMKINSKDPNSSTDIFISDLSIYKIDTNSINILTKAYISRTGGIDCSPNENEIFFSAIEVDNSISGFKDNMEADAFGYLYNVKNNEIKKTGDKIINFAQYSPDGTKILVKAKSDNSTIDLGYYDVKDYTYHLIIKDTVDSVSTNTTSAQAYPTWFDNNAVLYWRLGKVYGSSGEAIQLMSINLTNLKKQNLQPAIDTEVNKLIEIKGGY